MCGKTHIEGGRLAFCLTTILCYFISPVQKHSLILNIIGLLLIHFSSNYASTMKDLDHAESNIGNAPLFSYLIYGICHKVERKHRSIFTHNILIDIILWFIPALVIVLFRYKVPFASVEVMYLCVCLLLGMFFGNLSHIILDMFTVEGVFSPTAFVKLLSYRMSGKEIGYLRSKYRTRLIVKKHSFVFMLRRPYIRRVSLEDYGRTGGQYEDIVRANLKTLNCVAIHLVIIFAFGPNFRDILRVFLHH